jgi:hypothetical protein
LRNFLLISILISCLFCTKKLNKVDTIQGNWREVSSYYPDYVSIGYAHFSGDSAILNNFEYQKFKLKEDSLILVLNRPYEHTINGFTNKEFFKIESLSKDSLVLIENREYWNGFDVVEDTVKYLFKRFTQIPNQPKLVKIEFASGWCFGKCPQRDVVIDSSGYFYYGPRKYDEIKSPLTSNSEKDLFNTISFLVSSIPVAFLDTLDGYYNADSQRLVTNLFFEKGLKKQIISDHNNSLMPIFMKLEHSVNFANNLKNTDRLDLKVREKVNSLRN